MKQTSKKNKINLSLEYSLVFSISTVVAVANIWTVFLAVLTLCAVSMNVACFFPLLYDKNLTSYFTY